MKAGKEYELLIEKMYRSLEPNAIVTHDDKIYDEKAKTNRQIDVSIKYQFAGVEHLIIVQAKDHKTKIDIKIVDQFQQVIEDTNANKGILICPIGFTATAINKAKSYGIECLTVHSALNKKWETLLQIPVRKIIHDFSMISETMMNIEGKTDNFRYIEDTYSYDGVNIISLSDIIKDHIISKMGWEYIKKSKKLRIDFKKLGLYHSFDFEMLPVIEGFVEINYLKSSVQNFYIIPDDYIYSTDHIRKTNQLHNLTITSEMLESIARDDFTNNKEIKDKPKITLTLYKFVSDNATLMYVQFLIDVKAGIMGSIFVKDNTIMLDDERARLIVKLESLLKKQNNS